MKIKNIKKPKLKTRMKVYLAILCTALAVGSGCSKKEINNDKNLTVYETENNKNDMLIQNESSNPSKESYNTLTIYNNYLEQIGSSQKLTPQDIQNIALQTNTGLLAIKRNDGEYFGVVGSYKVIETSEKSLELVLDKNSLDLFTGKKRETLEFNLVSDLSDFIQDNNIDPTGYVIQVTPAWNDKDKDFIKTYYNEDVLGCLKENGFPIPCYDVNDFYNKYNENKDYGIKLK